VIRHPDDPRGQVLIISAVAMIVLLAIGALVLDLGMSWLLHRQEQNAVDPGALAAAHWVAPFGTQAQMEAEACFYAQQNGFFVGDANCAAALGSGDLQVNSPPATDKSGNFRGRPGFVEVVIHDTHPSFFGGLLGRPVAHVTTAAVAANTEGNSNSSSLISLGGQCSPPDDGDSTVTGGGTLYIHPATGVTSPGGFVNVNANCGAIRTSGVCDGNGNASALAITGGATLTAPHVFVTGACGTGGGGTLECYPIGSPPCLDEQAIPTGDPLGDLPEPWPLLNGALPVPDCPDPTEINSPSDPSPCTLSASGGNAPCPTGVCTMYPGVYYAGWDIKSSVQVVMKPGMYVLAGFGIQTVAGAELSAITDTLADGTIIDARVTIFSTEHTPGCQAGQPKFCQGSININSNGPLILKATSSTTCQQVTPAICTWKGILLWQDDTVIGTSKDISITGQSDLVLSGTIYAPESDVSITGGANSTGCGGSPEICLAIQIISRQWKIAGQGVMDMPYDPDELYQLEQQGLVH